MAKVVQNMAQTKINHAFISALDLIIVNLH